MTELHNAHAPHVIIALYIILSFNVGTGCSVLQAKMASSESESTPSPQKKPSPVSTPSHKWEMLDIVDLESGQDFAEQKTGLSLEGEETRHPLGFQQTEIWGQFTEQPPAEHGSHSKSRSPSPPEEPALLSSTSSSTQSTSALVTDTTRQKERKLWRDNSYPQLLKTRSEQYQVKSKSPTSKSKSLSPSPQSHKSSPSPRSPLDAVKKAGATVGKLFGKSESPKFESTAVESKEVVNLATITNRHNVPQEVSCC